jgi:hypothetical protein
MNNNNIFPCTSVKLKKFLMDKGLEYFNILIKDGWTTWQFAKTPKLYEALKEWTILKQTNKD